MQNLKKYRIHKVRYSRTHNVTGCLAGDSAGLLSASQVRALEPSQQRHSVAELTLERPVRYQPLKELTFLTQHHQ